MPKPQPPKPPSSDSAGLLSEVGAKIVHYIQAGYPGLYLVSAEEQRVEAELKAVVAQLNTVLKRSGKSAYTLCYWSVVSGLVHTDTNKAEDLNDPLQMLDAVAASPVRDTLVLGGDVHSFWATDLHRDLTRPGAAVATEFVGGSITDAAPVFTLTCAMWLPASEA